jgi:hypothetical protein
MSLEYPCIYYNKGKCDYLGKENTEFCVMSPCEYETMSNGDKIRSLTDEELKDFLNYYVDAYYAPDGGWSDWVTAKYDKHYF